MKTTLRWIAVPFAAILASVLVHIIATFVLELNHAGAEIYTGMKVLSITTIICGLIRDGIVGYAFVMAGCYTAPSNRKIVSIVLSTIMTVFCIVMILTMLLTNFSIYTLLGIIATAVGSIIGSAQAYKIFDDISK